MVDLGREVERAVVVKLVSCRLFLWLVGLAEFRDVLGGFLIGGVIRGVSRERRAW